MAKDSNKGGGPGTYTSGGVRCTMDAPFKGGADKGSQKDLSGTFDKGRSGGDNGLPTRVTDNMGGPKAGGAGKAINVSSIEPTGPNRPGTTQGKY